MNVELRPLQTFAVEQILKAFDDGVEVVVLSSPTGSGKSVVAAEVARRSAKGTLVTTPQRSLVAQYSTDPNVSAIMPSLRTMTGRANFECERSRRAYNAAAPNLKRTLQVDTAEEAICYELTPAGSILQIEDEEGNKRDVPCRYRVWGDDLPSCPYYHAKAEAELSPFIVSTLAYFLPAAVAYDPDCPGPVPGWIRGHLSGREVLFVDEAHGIEADIARYLTARFTEDSYRLPDYAAAFAAWRLSPEAEKIEDLPSPSDEDVVAALNRWIEEIGPVVRNQVVQMLDAGERRALERLKNAVEYLRDVVVGLERKDPWIVKSLIRERRGVKERTLEITPVVIAPYLRDRLWNRAARIILASGTIVNAKGTLANLGLDGRRAREIILPSEFPPENGPIFRIPAARVTHATKEEAFPKVVAALYRAMDVEPGRGLVHTMSFSNARYVAEHAPPHLAPRLILHEADGEMDRDELIKFFRDASEKDSVLLSPSVTEGLDLPDDLGTWVAFVKAPYANLQDERVSRRKAMSDGRVWYEQNAIVATIQGRGRILRSKTDRGTCYILDTAHVALLDRWWPLLPRYIAEAVHAGDAILDGGLRDRILGNEVAAQ